MMSGLFCWYNVDENRQISNRKIVAENESRKICHGNIIPNAQYGNEILIFDMPATDDAYAASFRGFLYGDGKISGKLRWVKEIPGLPDEMNGKYKKMAKKRLVVKGICTESNGAKDGFYFELELER